LDGYGNIYSNESRFARERNKYMGPFLRKISYCKPMLLYQSVMHTEAKPLTAADFSARVLIIM
jgi:hypothetical protein